MSKHVMPAQAGIQTSVPEQQRPTLFISDLHLTSDRPRPVELFYRFVNEIAPHAQALYILGDFFEAWVGDDDLALPFHAEIAAALQQLARQGIALYYMPGNRDFLAGQALAQATGWTALADPTVIDLYSIPTLISHGDAYCTDDAAYQAFRKQVREAQWQREFLAQPIAARRAAAKAIRERSEQAKVGKKPDIMDVNPDAIRAAMTQAGVTRLIHGHTHRPARHEVDLGHSRGERWVLADWYETGGYLTCDRRGCRLEDLK